MRAVERAGSPPKPPSLGKEMQVWKLSAGKIQGYLGCERNQSTHKDMAVETYKNAPP